MTSSHNNNKKNNNNKNNNNNNNNIIMVIIIIVLIAIVCAYLCACRCRCQISYFGMEIFLFVYFQIMAFFLKQFYIFCKSGCRIHRMELLRPFSKHFVLWEGRYPFPHPRSFITSPFLYRLLPWLSRCPSSLAEQMSFFLD